MATTTPNYGWPVPTSTDYVKDGAVAIEALGDAIDATVFGLPSAALTLVSATTIGTTVASVTVTGAFSATYQNYLIIMDGSTASSVGNFVSMTLNGSAGSTYNYSGNYHPYGGANVVNTASGSTPAYVAQSGADFTTGFNMLISLPFLTKKTTYTSDFATASYAGRIGGYDNNAVSHTAFTIGITSGTLTGGTIRVYGYKNS